MNKKIKKILLTSLIGASSIGVVATATAIGINVSNKQTTTNDDNQNTLGGSTSSISSSFGYGKMDATASSYKFAITKASNDSTNKTYKIKIEDNNNKEGKIYLVDSSNKSVDELSFNPGETIKIGVNLNKGYETYTVRDLKIYGLSENIFVPTKKDTTNNYTFLATMPNYDDTIDKETGNSWFYDENTDIKVIPSFIVQSIGNNNNQVDWEHGAFADSLNGYVYEMQSDMTFSDAKQEIYQVFENKNIDYPIDIYFYLNGHTITLDNNVVDFDILSGWGLHFYNNKTDSLTSDGKYGEIKVSSKLQTSLVPISGALYLGSSVKFKHYATTDGVKFVNYDDTSLIADFVSNDPSIRLSK